MKSIGGDFTPIPRELDTEAKFLLWDFDIVACFTVGVAIGIVIGHFWTGTLMGFIFAKGWSRLRTGQAKGFALHTLYWTLPCNPFKRMPASHRRDFIG